MTFRSTWRGPQVSQQVRAAGARGLSRAAEHVLAQSREQVPLDEGTLSRSGATDLDPANMVATVSYDTVYAARQHEEIGWRHQGGRKAKYLEDPLLDSGDVQQRIIADEIRRELS